MSNLEDIEDWSEACRGCLSKTTLIPIFDESNDIRSKFFESTSIMISENDGLPGYLCLDCLDTLNYAHQFKKECLRIDKVLRNKINLGKSFRKEKTEQEAIKNKSQNSKTNNLNNEINDESVVKIKIEQTSDEENDSEDNSYYVVVVKDVNGEKVVETIKMNGLENLPIVKTELDFNIDDVDQNNGFVEMDTGEDIELEDCETVHMDPTTGLMGDASEETIIESNGQDENSQSQNGETIHEVPVDTIIMEQDFDNMDERKLNLMQVLGSTNDDGNMIQYRNDVTLVGEVMSGDLSIVDDSTAYTQEEVIVGEIDSEMLANGDIPLQLDEEHETITVMQQEDGSFLCPCGESYMDFSDYETHIEIHNVHKCPICNRGFESTKMVKGHLLLHNSADSTLSCPFCKQRVRRTMLTMHIRLNHSENKPTCDVCNKTFANEQKLKRHILTHNLQTSLECHVCPMRFHQKAALQNHMLTHTNIVEKANECEACGKHYATLASLKSHMDYCVKIASESELLCSECGEVLPSRKAMYTHAYTHRQMRMKTLKRFSCSMCGKWCASHALLLMHERVHTNERPFQCPNCPLAFKTKTHLTTHQLTHTQEKRFGCSVCMKFFALKGNLVVHLRTHTGERPYVCSICNQAFIDSKYLKKHKQRRHDISNIPWNQYY